MNTRRGQTQGRISIEQRPEIVKKQRFGDLQIDLIIKKTLKALCLQSMIHQLSY